MENQEVEKAQPSSGLFLLKNMLLDLVFPPSCLRCGRVDWQFCESCQAVLKDLPTSPVFAELAPFAGVVATGKHEGILQEAVQALKYNQARGIASILAERMASSLNSCSWTFDTVIPIPISSLRLKERGYNQAKEMSYHLARQLNIPHQAEALRKIRHTQSQVGLNQTERLANLKEAFSADSSIVKGKTLLLVDDVRSTGTTLVECAQTAIEAGASVVYAITVTAASI
jgi:competence protein ComFC